MARVRWGYFVLIGITVLVTFGCNSSGDDTDNTNEDGVAATIVGEWSFIYPSIQCKETYVFSSGNTFSATSLDEEFGGTYELSDQPNSSNRHPMSLRINSDNQQADCEGDAENDVGLLVDIYVEFVTSTEMDWYQQSSGGEPVVTLTKN